MDMFRAKILFYFIYFRGCCYMFHKYSVMKNNRVLLFRGEFGFVPNFSNVCIYLSTHGH